MKHLHGPIVSLGIAGLFLISAVVTSQAQQAGGFIVTFVPQEEKKAEAVKKEEVKKDPAKRPAIKFKVFDKEAVKKEEAKDAVTAKQKARAEAVQKMVVQRQRVAAGEPDPQVMQQYRHMLWAEYLMANSVCDLTPDQRKAIARDAEHTFQEAIAKSGGNRQMHGIGRVFVNNNQQPRTEPDDTIREGLTKAVKSRLTPEQLARYDAEIGKRAANRRRIVVDNITAKLDELMALTGEQRDKIRESIAANWKESWCPAPETLLFNPQMLPQIPDPFVTPFLNEAQKSIWRGLHKFPGANFRSFGFMANNLMNGESPEDDALREAREAETKARDVARAKREAEEKQKAEAKKADDDAKTKVKFQDAMKKKAEAAKPK